MCNGVGVIKKLVISQLEHILDIERTKKRFMLILFS